MTPQELKNSILQLAIQGKLVAQRPEEGTAEELYAQIQAEKQNLIKAGKIKKEKPLPEIAEDEELFEIPGTWKWVYIGELFQHNTGKAQNASVTVKNGVKRQFITTSNLYWNEFDFSHIKEMLFTRQEIEKCTASKGDLLVCEGGDVGRAAIWTNEEDVCIQNHVHRLRAYIELHTMFFYYIFYLYKFTGRLHGRGVGIKGLSSGALHEIKCPLPPLAEQKRIVAKIEELLPYIDRYAEAWNKLEDFNKRFPDDMKKSILQMAIQGKLVEQRPEEGTAEELYEQIQKEKQKLIKEGKIKKEKPLPEINEDEIPFEIPESWKWVRLNDIASKNIKRGKSPAYISNSNTLVFAQKCNTKAGVIDLDLALYLDETKLEKYPNEEFMQHLDIVINSTGGGTLGRVGIYRKEDNKRGLKLVPDSHVTVIRVLNGICVEYAFYCLKHYQPYMEKLGSGSTNQTELNAHTVKSLLFPLPPLAEQKRIVDRIEELLPICEGLKGSRKE